MVLSGGSTKYEFSKQMNTKYGGAALAYGGDDYSVAQHVCSHVDSWNSVDPSSCEVKEYSKHGGAATYKVTARDRGSICLNLRPESIANDEISEDCMREAQNVFAAADLSPARIAGGDLSDGSRWWAEEWWGTVLAPQDAAGSVIKEAMGNHIEDLGMLMARMHANKLGVEAEGDRG